MRPELKLPEEWMEKLGGRVCIAIGNGPSRLPIEQLMIARVLGAVLIGANGFYTELMPNLLVVGDQRFQKKLLDKRPEDLPTCPMVSFDENHCPGLTSVGGKAAFSQLRGSGAVALHLARCLGSTAIFATGYDGEGPSTYWDEDPSKRMPGYIKPGDAWHRKTGACIQKIVKDSKGQIRGHVGLGPSKWIKPQLEVSVLWEALGLEKNEAPSLGALGASSGD